jgi:hypothetical protein
MDTKIRVLKNPVSYRTSVSWKSVSVSYPYRIYRIQESLSRKSLLKKMGWRFEIGWSHRALTSDGVFPDLADLDRCAVRRDATTEQAQAGAKDALVKD